MSSPITVVDHPLVQHKLTLMRRKETPTATFRQLIREIALLLAYEVTRDLPLEKQRIETPLVTVDAPILTGKKLVLISVLRAKLAKQLDRRAGVVLAGYLLNPE